MYVPTGFVGRPGYLTWQQLRQLEASGRWQIDEHAGDGHVLVTVDPQGKRLPFYAAERWENGRRESFTRYKARVVDDIERGAVELARNLPGWRSHGTFAVPYGNYGENGSNDPRIEPWLSGYLRAHFAVTFVQGDSFTTPRQWRAERIIVSSSLDDRTLETRLLRGLGVLSSRRASS